ncbi:MAG: hypothetical protein RIB32_01960 [Phycisphaerales bacterium]
MNQTITITALAAACLALGACETTTTTANTPEQRLDVAVDGGAPPANQQPSTPAVTAVTAEPAEQSRPRDVAVESTQAAPVMATPPRPAPARESAQPPQQWWLMTPDPVEGRIRIVAKGGGATLPAARQAAVDAGRAQLTRLRGSAPEDLEFEKTQAFPRAGGVYEAFVLISCER